MAKTSMAQAFTDLAPQQATAAVPGEKSAQEQPAARPNVWQRLAGLVLQKQETALQVYRRLLAKIDRGQDLKDTELSQFAEAMQQANISQEQLEQHRKLLAEYATAKAAADALPPVQERYEDARAELIEIDAQLKALAEAREATANRLENARFAFVDVRTAASRLEGLAVEKAELLGE